MIVNRCGDDKVTSGWSKNRLRADPCLKLYVGSPIMVSTSDNKKGKNVKQFSSGLFKGVVLKDDNTLKEELWNDYIVYTVEANEVDYIVCEQPNKTETLQLNMKWGKISLLTCQNQNPPSSQY